MKSVSREGENVLSETDCQVPNRHVSQFTSE